MTPVSLLFCPAKKRSSFILLELHYSVTGATLGSCPNAQWTSTVPRRQSWCYRWRCCPEPQPHYQRTVRSIALLLDASAAPLLIWLSSLPSVTMVPEERGVMYIGLERVNILLSLTSCTSTLCVPPPVRTPECGKTTWSFRYCHPVVVYEELSRYWGYSLAGLTENHHRRVSWSHLQPHRPRTSTAPRRCQPCRPDCLS